MPCFQRLRPGSRPFLWSQIAPEGKIYDAWDYRENFPDGRIGSNPGLPNDHGERLMDLAVEDLLVCT